ncbi:hypothetical protein [Novosphingobium sp. ST904]|uniref:hypothetical protein n=1 Tax=Novosphingobium sp. ST904 TaxID=1684385 RepID=UPI0006C88940|nr:hypothetical protein [Novosphingobium sp. ST904]KPH63594.1 hypothetical protein ADT71_13320 [Novosphingobium sp. ST904]TCM32313.1 hypothetical protein EDF59_1247 [Novosphingobium sp. ST904]
MGIDWDTYLITHDQPGGPLITSEMEYAPAPTGPFSKGEKIGYILGVAIMIPVLIWMVSLTL